MDFFIPTTLTHTHTHDPRLTTSIHDPRQLVILPARRHERLYNIKGEELKLLRTNSSQRTFACKMELASLHDFYGSWHLYICRSLFGHSTFFLAFFVDSLVFMKGTSCCVIRRNSERNWAVGSCYGKVLKVIDLHDFEWFRCYLHVASWSLTPL